MSRLRRLLRAVHDDESGMTLIEILIAVFVLSVALLALASTATASLQSVRVSRDRQQATQMATSVLEEARARKFGELALATTTLSTDPIYLETVVPVIAGGLPHITTLDRHTITTWVTYVPGTSQKQKRVQAVVRWTDRGKTRTVREETLIVEATRGLDAPSFVVSQPTTGTGTPGETICFEHTLNNTGDTDGYSWQLWATDLATGTLVEGQRDVRSVREPSGTGYTIVTREGFRVPAGAEGSGWFGWARMDTPKGGTIEPMVETTGDVRPDSADRLPALTSTPVLICYTPLSPGGVLTGQTKADNTATFTPRIHSAFDESVTTTSQSNEITNTVQVVPANTLYYLHHRGLFPDLEMDPVAPDPTDPAFAPRDHDGDGVPGLGLGDVESVSWSFQFGQLSQVSGTPVLRFWTRTESAPTATDEDGNIIPWTLVFDLELERRNTIDGTTTALSVIDDVSVVGVTNEWMELAVALPLTSAADFQQNDFIRVVLTCDDDSTTDCHIDYDVDDGTTSHASRLEATVN